MKCCRCPLYHYWSDESDRGEACAIFGDGWDSPFQYEDKEGTIVGCYLDRHFIEKADAERDEYYESMAESMARQLKAEANTPQTSGVVWTENDMPTPTSYSTSASTADTPQTGRKNCTLELFDDDGNYIVPQTDCPKSCPTINICTKDDTDCPWK